MDLGAFDETGMGMRYCRRRWCGNDGDIDTETCRGSFSSNRVVRSVRHPQRRGGKAPPYCMATVLSGLAAARAGGETIFPELSEALYLPQLDDLYARLQACPEDGQEVSRAMADLFSQLRCLRERTRGQQWQKGIAVARSHPIRQLVHQDPFTHRAFSRPRGYAGDAELLDFIYGREEGWPPPPATLLGQHIFELHDPGPGFRRGARPAGLHRGCH